MVVEPSDSGQISFEEIKTLFDVWYVNFFTISNCFFKFFTKGILYYISILNEQKKSVKYTYFLYNTLGKSFEKKTLKIWKNWHIKHQQNHQNWSNFDHFVDVWYVNFFKFSTFFFHSFYEGYYTENMYISQTFFCSFKSGIL